MNILVDTREKHSYSFNFFLEPGDTVTHTKLDYGDYTIQGLEDKVVVERKASTAEIARNIGVDRKRFYREMEVIKDFDHAIFLCEFNEHIMAQFPNHSGIPARARNSLRISAGFLQKSVYELRDNYNLELVFCSDPYTAEQWVFNFLKQKEREYAGTISDLGDGR